MVDIKTVVLDSYALLMYLNDETGSDEVESILRRGAKEELMLVMNDINLGEVFYQIAKVRNLEIAEEKIAEILRLKIEWLTPDRRMILNAARYKSLYSISYADAFLVTTCQETGGALLTGDPEFHQLETEISVRWLPKKSTKKNQSGS